VAQDYCLEKPAAEAAGHEDWRYLVEIAYRPGVTDPVAMTARQALHNWRPDAVTPETRVRSARQYLFACRDLASREQERIFSSLYNPLVETELILTRAEWDAGRRPPAAYPDAVAGSEVTAREFELDPLDDQALVAFSREKLLALSLEEMRAVREHFADQSFLAARSQAGLSGRITDVEIEMIAQTWSEHCKHKIFNAEIDYREEGRAEKIVSVFKTFVKKTTDLVGRRKKYLLSVFEDDSGVIRFDRRHALCFKVETHNSPSALDPYGGAITGIVGVNRDILATGRMATPIFNTNVLCFADPATPEGAVPAGLLHPRRVMEGVHRGIIDGGNQSGIPVVAGAFLFDPDYLGKPLVFCGTGGLLPARLRGEKSWVKIVRAGDLAVMVGGRIGKDGIHGATFSSLALDETSPPSAVQIGDPITQKKMWDFLEEARGLTLFKGLTDNGAGGLSSSLGELAKRSGGVEIDLDRCPLKYQGLAPWEILVSESQERMSVAVNPANVEAFLALAARRSVEATVVGRFTDSGFIRVRYGGKTVGLLDIGFLHDGLPVMRLKAEWTPPARQVETHRYESNETLLLKVLANPNVSSRESLVRQYDHEVRGCSVVKPFAGINADGHADGAVYKPVFDSWRGFTVTHGIAPRLSPFDAYDMAAHAVDEAFRAHIALGGDPEYAAALDNFCWPDPIAGPANPDGEYKLAQLVRAARGLKDACLAYGLPLISGKDSMKNDAFVAASNGRPARKISIKPTLLVSLVGIVVDVRRALTTDFKAAGDLVFVIGETGRELGGSILEQETGNAYPDCPKVNFGKAMKLYRILARALRKGLVRSCHDCSEGGLAVALAESAFGGRLGFSVALDDLPRAADPARADAATEATELLFAESASRFVATVPPSKAKRFQSLFKKLPAAFLGIVTEERKLTVRYQNSTVLALGLDEALRAWKGRLA
jgi:phosphoribosylformylglycinamidine synthase II